MTVLLSLCVYRALLCLRIAMDGDAAEAPVLRPAGCGGGSSLLAASSVMCALKGRELDAFDALFAACITWASEREREMLPVIALCECLGVRVCVCVPGCVAAAGSCVAVSTASCGLPVWRPSPLPTTSSDGPSGERPRTHNRCVARTLDGVCVNSPLSLSLSVSLCVVGNRRDPGGIGDVRVGRTAAGRFLAQIPLGALRNTGHAHVGSEGVDWATRRHTDTQTHGWPVCACVCVCVWVIVNTSVVNSCLRGVRFALTVGFHGHSPPILQSSSPEPEAFSLLAAAVDFLARWEGGWVGETHPTCVERVWVCVCGCVCYRLVCYGLCGSLLCLTCELHTDALQDAISTVSLMDGWMGRISLSLSFPLCVCAPMCVCRLLA